MKKGPLLLFSPWQRPTVCQAVLGAMGQWRICFSPALCRANILAGNTELSSILHGYSMTVVMLTEEEKC